MKFASTVFAVIAPLLVSASASELRGKDRNAVKADTKAVTPQVGHKRSLAKIEDLQFIRLGDDFEPIFVTVNQTAVNGLLTYGDALVAVGPPVAGAGTEVTCYAQLSSTLVDMQFFLRKAIIPDEDGNGNAKDFDCQASGDMDFISPDSESCSVTNFNDIGDFVVAYVAIIDDPLTPLGTTYRVDFRCAVTATSSSWFCFSEEATVEVLGKGEVKMPDLAIGDYVRAGESYEPVYAFAHLDKTTPAPYLHISTDTSNDPLEISAEHLLYANGKYVAAKDIKVGDILMDASHTEAKVQQITTKEKTGLYAPLTPSGTLIVNGIQTSAYVSLQNNSQGTLKLGNLDTRLSFHTLNHIALTPIRMACMGISSNFCSNQHIDQHSGYPPFVSFWLALVQCFEHQTFVLQLALLLLFFSIVGPLFVVESILGATLAPVVLLFGAPILVRKFMTSKNQNNPTRNALKV